METKHTPGPWVASGGVIQPSVSLPDGSVWTELRPSRYDKESWGDFRLRSRANTRLIAAAPELLEALEACLPYVLMGASAKAQYDFKEPIRQLIAKAKGE